MKSVARDASSGLRGDASRGLGGGGEGLQEVLRLRVGCELNGLGMVQVENLSKSNSNLRFRLRLPTMHGV